MTTKYVYKIIRLVHFIANIFPTNFFRAYNFGCIMHVLYTYVRVRVWGFPLCWLN